MNPVLTRPPRAAPLFRAGAMLIVLAAAGGAVLALSRLGLGDAPSYRRLTVENPSPYTINIEATGTGRDGWHEVGTVRREGRATFEELVDPGDQWVFRFSYGGVEAGELVVSDDQLARDGWTITVPASVTGRLRDAGLSESPP